MEFVCNETAGGCAPLTRRMLTRRMLTRRMLTRRMLTRRMTQLKE